MGLKEACTLMARHREFKDRGIPCSIAMPAEIWERLDLYLHESKSEKSRSEFYREYTESVLEEWEKQRQLAQLSSMNTTNNSAIGKMLSRINKDNKNDNKIGLTADMVNRKAIQLIEQFVDSTDDIKQLSIVFSSLKRTFAQLKLKIDKIQTPRRVGRVDKLYAATSEGKARLLRRQKDNGNEREGK
jgi:predicted DNA-binding protein